MIPKLEGVWCAIDRNRAVSIVVWFAMLSGCASNASLRVYPDDVPAGSLRLVQAIQVGTRQDTVNVKEWYEAILASGINDSEIVDGSVVVGRVWCCGGPVETTDRQAFYVPKGLIVKPLDIVEIRAGQDPARKSPARVNIATRVVQTAESKDTTCRWVPPNPRLWMRVLYCDWMEKEGWIELDETLKHTWYKPPTVD
jgi:hypothetical protein